MFSYLPEDAESLCISIWIDLDSREGCWTVVDGIWTAIGKGVEIVLGWYECCSKQDSVDVLIDLLAYLFANFFRPRISASKTRP